MDETVTFFQPPPPRQGPRRRPVSVLALNGHLVSRAAFHIVCVVVSLHGCQALSQHLI
jgi:hypothetical protein